MGAMKGMPSGSAGNLEAVSRFANKVLGKPITVLHERYSPDLHIDLLYSPARPSRDFAYVVTSGMSDRPMADGNLAELVIALPATWDVSPKGIQDPPTWEPLKMLKLLAHYPHQNKTYFEPGDTLPYAEEPLVAPMTGILVHRPVLIPEFREPLEVADRKSITFLAPYLLHPSELQLKLDGGMSDLLDRFGKGNVTEMYDVSRRRVV